MQWDQTKDGFYKATAGGHHYWRLTKDECQQAESELAEGKRWVGDLSPSVMLKLGVFSGCYFHTMPKEANGLPKSWFNVPAYTGEPVTEHNHFGIKASQPIEVWRANGWIPDGYPLGWFHWYCFYYLGKAQDSVVNDRQIARAKSFASRQGGKAVTDCKGNLSCKPRLRQSLLHWASSRGLY